MALGRSTTMSALTCPNPSPSPYLKQPYRRHRRFCKPGYSYFSLDPVVKVKHRHLTLGSQESYYCRSRFNVIKAKGKSDYPIPEEDPPPPPQRSSPGWKKWMAGIALSMILPSYRYRHKWGPLILLRDKVDEAIETVEVMTDIAENLGEAAEKLAAAVEKKIPDEDSKLKEAVEAVDRLAKEAVKEAEEAKRLIHEVEKIEKKVEILAGIEFKGEEEKS